MISFCKRSYGYDLTLKSNTDLSGAISVTLTASTGSTSKTLPGNASGSDYSATVPENFWTTTGVWELRLEAQFAGSRLCQKQPIQIMITN